jgi:predicted ester cyclase
MGIAATNKQVAVTGMDIHHIVNGKIAEHWSNWDTVGLLQQLGVVPTSG